jgi:predicted nuclease of predicted toxin-antitoxin system
MTLSEFRLLADENIEPQVVAFLRSQKFDVTYIPEMGWQGRQDIDILAEATTQNRVVVTQDDDFGKIIFTTSTPFIGIIYLRPGHFFPERTIISLQSLLTHNELDYSVPFILVVEDKMTYIKIRLRNI